MSATVNIEISGPKLKKARGKMAMAHAAKAVGISRQHLFQIENDQCRANGDVVARLCVLYGVRISDLTRAETNGKRKAVA
jgi:DNA-binding XRE family transcriptional regulator